ncbi:MAG: hypothetical protein AAFV93_25495 [Chloroflexota bacterium]
MNFLGYNDSNERFGDGGMQRLLDFLQNMLNVSDRIKRFDFRELTFTQIFFGIAGLLVALWIFGQLLSFVLGILNIVGPLALLAMVAFMGVRYARSRADELPDDMTKSRKEREVEQAVANVQAHLQETGEAVETDVEGRIDVAEAEEVTVQPAEEDNLIIKQIVNPETGFKEPDITRLIEHEEAKLKEADKVNDDIMTQIEARRKRLNNQ